MYVCKESVHVGWGIVFGQSGLEGLESGSLCPILGQAVSVSFDSQELRELSAAGHGIREMMSVSGSSAVSVVIRSWWWHSSKFTRMAHLHLDYSDGRSSAVSISSTLDALQHLCTDHQAALRWIPSRLLANLMWWGSTRSRHTRGLVWQMPCRLVPSPTWLLSSGSIWADPARSC